MQQELSYLVRKANDKSSLEGDPLAFIIELQAKMTQHEASLKEII